MRLILLTLTTLVAAPVPTVSWDRADVDRGLRAYINTETMKDNGWFDVKDPKTGELLKLTIAKLFPEKIVTLADGSGRVRGDFTDKLGREVTVEFKLGKPQLGRELVVTGAELVR